MSKSIRVVIFALEKFPILQSLADFIPSPMHQRFNEFRSLSQEYAKGIIDGRKNEGGNSEDSKDMLSILSKANAAVLS